MAKIEKILLVNDARGSQEYLHRAFRELGVECDIALFGAPTIEPIANLLQFDPLRRWGMIGKVPRPFINLLNVSKLKDYDVASYVHRISFIDKPHFLRFRDIPIVREKTRVMSYTGLGCDEISFIFANELLPYRPCSTCQRYDDPNRKCERIVRPLKSVAIDYLNKYFDSVTSTMVEYDHVSAVYHGPVSRIPLPVDLSEIPWMPAGSNKGSKVKIIHTPSRKGFKGTAVVLEAIERLQEMRTDFEFSIVSGLPFNEYLSVIGGADIVIDQVWSQSPGMNALWLAAMGKVVFSGNTRLAQDYFNVPMTNPIINAEPDSEKLALSLCSAISSKDTFRRIGELGREYIRSNHSHIDIARQYINLWESRLQ